MAITLVAIAALAATGAFAQSSVAITGVVDAGYGSFSSQNTGAAKLVQKGIQYNADNTSRWQIKAVEDIGGGVKAGTTIESALSTNPGRNFGWGTGTTGVGAVTNTDYSLTGVGNTIDAQKIGDRIMTVDLTMGAHTINAGNQAQPTRAVAVGFQADGSNLIGNLVGNDDTLVGRVVAINYVYNAGNGLNVGGAYMANTKTKDGVNDSKTKNGYALTARYTQGPLDAGAVWSKQTTNDAAAAPAAATPAASYVATAQLLSPVANLGAAAKNVETTSTVLGVSYDLSVAKLYGQYASTANEDTLNATKNWSKRHATSVGVRVPFGKAWAFAQLSNGKNQITGGASAAGYEGDWKGHTVGVKYDMSKRTYAYVGAGSAKFGTTATTESKASQYAMGLVHSF